MKIDANDPKWTAYALGEISDPQERAEIESLLEQSPEMRQLVDEIRGAADFLAAQLRTEPSMGLTPAQRALIQEKAHAPRNWFGLKPVWAIACAMAAVALISFIAIRQLKQVQPILPTVQVAQNSATPHNTAPAGMEEPVKTTEPNKQSPIEQTAQMEKKTPSLKTQETSPAPVQPSLKQTPVQTAENRPPEPAVFNTPSFSTGPSWLGGSGSGSFYGTIKDPSGAVVPGASVTVTNAETNVATKYTTNNAGTFNASGLLPGYYEVTVEKEGFAKNVSKAIRLENGVHQLNAKLETGKISEIVEVNIKAENIILENGSSVGMVIPQDSIAKLPLINSNVLDLVKVMGGVVISENPIFGADDTTLAGLSAANVNVQKDGVTANNVRWTTGMNAPVNLNPEIVSEFKVATTPVEAEKGRGSGQVKAAALKSEVHPISTKTVESASAQAAPPAGSGGGMGGGGGSGNGPGVGPGIGGGMGFGMGSGSGAGAGPGSNAYRGSAVWNTQDRDSAGGPAPSPPPRPRYDSSFDRRRTPPPYMQSMQFNTESYDPIRDNPFQDVVQNPLSTFSIDVDTASYSNMRRFLERGSRPPRDSIRIEELVNYFDYDYEGPGSKDNKPFAVHFELTEAPWKTDHMLLRVGVKGREINPGKRPPCNLVFLLDVSGSMGEPNKLPLVQQSMQMLLNNLTENDKVAIVIYREITSVLLPSTNAYQKARIAGAINSLEASGTTNGAAGLQLAYQVAQNGFIKNGTNRVILATDGDFNTGITNRGDLNRLIEDEARSGIFLTALGFGMGNLKDSTLEMLANKGRGNYAYIDTLDEARKVLAEQVNATLVPIAKDVKIQVEFNPGFVSAYRLIGYEDKVLAKEDFNNDQKMAGVIGSGHTVTALYELVPADKSYQGPGVDPLKYQKPAQTAQSVSSDEMLTLKIRSKEPKSEESMLAVYTVKKSPHKFIEASQDFKFAAGVAAFGMVLRDSPYKGYASVENALEWAKQGQGVDKSGYRGEFIRLVHRAMGLNY